MNGRYFTRYQFKHMRRLVFNLAVAPPALERIEKLLAAPVRFSTVA